METLGNKLQEITIKLNKSESHSSRQQYQIVWGKQVFAVCIHHQPVHTRSGEGTLPYLGTTWRTQCGNPADHQPAYKSHSREPWHKQKDNLLFLIACLPLNERQSTRSSTNRGNPVNRTSTPVISLNRDRSNTNSQMNNATYDTIRILNWIVGGL